MCLRCCLRSRASLRVFGLGLVLLAASWAYASDETQEAPPPQAGGPAPTLEDAHGSVGFFFGASTASADGLEDGALFGGSGVFYFMRKLGVELGVQRRTPDVVGTSENGLSGGSLDQTIVTGSVVVRFPVNARLAPYVVGGVAYFSNSFEADPAVVSDLSALNFRLTEGMESKLGFNVGGGVDFLLAGRFGVFGEVRYLAVSADTSVELADTVSGVAAEDTGSQDLNGLAISAGVRVVF